MIKTLVASGIQANASGGWVAQDIHTYGNEEGRAVGNLLAGTEPQDDDIDIQPAKDLLGRLAKAAVASDQCNFVDQLFQGKLCDFVDLLSH